MWKHGAPEYIKASALEISKEQAKRWQEPCTEETKPLRAPNPDAAITLAILFDELQKLSLPSNVQMADSLNQQGNPMM